MKTRMLSLFSCPAVWLALWASPLHAQSDDRGNPDLKPALEDGDSIVPALRKPAQPGFRSRNARDRVSVFNPVVVNEGETVRQVVVVGGSATIDGTVENELVLVMSKATVGPNAEIRGDLVLVGTQLDLDPAAKILGDRVLVGATGTNLLHAGWLQWPQQWLAHGALYGRPLPPQHGWMWLVAALSLLLYLLALLLFPQQVQLAVEALKLQPGQSFLFGFLALLLLLPVLLLLTVTGIGLLLVPFVIGGTVVAYVFGKAAVYAYAGQRLGQQFHWPPLQHPVLGLVAGAVLFMLLYTIPIVGFLVWALVLPLGIGAVVQALTASVAKRVNEASAAAVPAPAPRFLAGDAAVDVTQLPRAGFWIRLLATLLDLVLVGAVGGFLGWQKGFLLMWVLYHLGFWTWKGTTVGGIVIGLKILRTDGTPLNFPVALVRSLASIFSFIVLGLGFFWAGWSPDKLSWHDKIADTILVRWPKGVKAI